MNSSTKEAIQIDKAIPKTEIIIILIGPYSLHWWNPHFMVRPMLSMFNGIMKPFFLISKCGSVVIL